MRQPLRAASSRIQGTKFGTCSGPKLSFPLVGRDLHNMMTLKRPLEVDETEVLVRVPKLAKFSSDATFQKVCSQSSG